MIAEVTRIRVDHRGDQRIDSTTIRPRATGSWGVQEACPQVESIAPLESLDPVVDRLATPVEEVGDIFDGIPCVEPEEGLCAASFLGRRGADHEGLQLGTLPTVEGNQCHRITSGAIPVSR
jgi:hypothetical protein